MSNPVRHIVFDLGNVLVRWDPEAPYRRLIPDDTARKRFLSEVCGPDWLLGLDRGAVTWREAEDALIARFPAEETLIRAFRGHWHEMVPHALDETVAVLDRLVAAGTDVTALSNIPADTYEECLPRFPFLGRFRGITASGAVGLAKPDPAIYRHHAAAFGLDPSATLFFDDVARNVAAATAEGWQAELFTGAADMRSALSRHGVAPFG